MTYDKNNIFAKILRGEIPCKKVYENESKVLVFFDKKSYDFKGWSIIDNFNNEILFSINIKSINGNYDPGIFKIPSIN